jgi:hypothetical protein
MSENSTKCNDCWQELIHAFSEVDRLRINLFAFCGQEGVSGFVYRALDNPLHWKIALELRAYLTFEQEELLFPRFLEIACSRHSLTRQFADAVCAFPSAWLTKHIELAADPLLTSEEAYWQLFAIYTRIDRRMALRLVAKASSSADPDVRAFAADNVGTVP